MSDHNVTGALHATKKLFDNGIARDNFMKKLKVVVMDDDHGDILFCCACICDERNVIRDERSGYGRSWVGGSGPALDRSAVGLKSRVGIKKGLEAIADEC